MRTILIFCISLIIFTVPTVSMAAIVPCDGTDCQTCHVVQLGQNILTWFIGVMAAVIALVFVIGGLKMVMAGGNEGEVTKARSMMTNAIIGFIILLASWLIVDTVMKTFVKGADGTGEEFLLGPWNEISCETQPELSERADETVATVEGGIPESIPRRTDVMQTNMDNVSMSSVWQQELSTASPYYNFSNVQVSDRSGFSIPIRVPNLSENMSLSIATLDQNGQLINNNTAEISGSRVIGSEVIASGVDRAKVILTPAYSGRVIYYNFMPTGLQVPVLVQTAMWFYPYPSD